MTAPPGEFDIFLSHATPDKTWVRTLAARLEALGLRVFLDEQEIRAGGNWVLRLNDGLQTSRYMVLVLSDHTADGRPWVTQEWTSFMGGHGPLGRLLPVKIDAVALPFILNAIQAIDALDRDAERAAAEIFRTVGDPSTLSSADDRRLVLGRDLVFTLSIDGDDLVVLHPDGSERRATLPWKQDNAFGIAHLEFFKLHREALPDGPERANLFRHAQTLGSALFRLLFDESDAAGLKKLIGPDRPRPVIQIRSGDPLLRSLPWELLHHDGRFLLREGDVDLVRTTTDEVDGATLPKAPTEPFKLVVNVSAPEGSALDYEGESYRISLATAERCAMVPTELGTLDDLIQTVEREAPQGIHFSGHGLPGALLFEDDEGRKNRVQVQDLIGKLRKKLPDDRRLPPFFYLASCHGNEPADLNAEKTGADSAAVQLHQAGVSQVVGYFGPIVDELSTRAEEALYEAIASGKTTRDAVCAARLRLAEPFHAGDSPVRPVRAHGLAEDQAAYAQAIDTHPFAWAQLVFYKRGPEWPLSLATEPGKPARTRVLKRSFEGFGDRRVLRAGFIGRRMEQHRIRSRLRAGARVFVLQGLGGLGKSTLAQKILPWLIDDASNVCTIWCQEVEKSEGSRADALVTQLLAYCRKRFGLDWEQVVQQVDREAGDDPAQRFLYFLHTLMQNAPSLVLYLDNLESLLNGPEGEAEEGAFGQWAEPALQVIWQNADRMARDSDSFYLVASCSYRHEDFGDALLPVSPLPPDALFRLTAWHPALQKLHARTRARLVARLDGHPRAVDYADDLVAKALTDWRNQHGLWSLSTPPKDEEIDREWGKLVEPALPAVTEKLKDNLLLQAIWDNVLDDRARRFLYRMTVLRIPAEWSLLGLLGEDDEDDAAAFATAERLRDTSLLEQMELFVQTAEDAFDTVTRYGLHASTAQFITDAHPADRDLFLATHRRLGKHLEIEAKTSPYIVTRIEAGHHLFEAGDYDRAGELLGQASQWLQQRGRVREGLTALAPFLAKPVQDGMAGILRGQMLGTIALGHSRLSEIEKAIGYYEQALIIAHEIGDREGESNTFGNLGNAYAALGEVEKAIGYHERALVISREIGNRHGEGSDLGSLGNAYAALGELEKAIGYYEQQLAIVREIGDARGEGNALGNLGIAYGVLREVEKAIGYHEQALLISREIGNRYGEGCDLGSLGNAYAALGEVEKAIGYYEQALIIVREIGDRRGEGNALGNLGLAYAALGEVEKAVGYHEQSLFISREIGDRRGEGSSLANLGLTYSRLDQIMKAKIYFQQSLAIGHAIKDPRIVKVCEGGLAQLSGRNE
ncbi:MAG: tetratricopeptide repeat protein [Alphaproteobacteria bacterium]